MFILLMGSKKNQVFTIIFILNLISDGIYDAVNHTCFLITKDLTPFSFLTKDLTPFSFQLRRDQPYSRYPYRPSFAAVLLGSQDAPFTSNFGAVRHAASAAKRQPAAACPRRATSYVELLRGTCLLTYWRSTLSMRACQPSPVERKYSTTSTL